jgi:predicted thioredoxin/glutaredoxin
VDVVLVSRQGCHLCDEALVALRSLGVEPEVRDVDADELLHDQYDFRVPVVLADGRVVGEGKVRREEFRRALDLA